MPKAFSRMPARFVDKRRREHVESRVFINRKKVWSLESGVKTNSRLQPSDSRLQTPDSRLFERTFEHEESWTPGRARKNLPDLSHREHQRARGRRSGR